MTDTNLVDAVVFPQDDGSGVPDGQESYDSAGSFSLLSRYKGDGNYVGEDTTGNATLQFNDVDTTNNEFDIGTGHAYINDSVSVQSGAQTSYDTNLPNDVPYVVTLPNEVTNLSLDAGTNDVWLAVDPTANDSVYVRHGSGLSAPADPSVKLGTIDASSGATTRGQDNADTTFSSVQTPSLQTKSRNADVVIREESGGIYHADGDSSEISSNSNLGDLIQTVIENIPVDDERIVFALSGTHTLTRSTSGSPIDLNRDNLTFEGPGWGLTLKMPDGHNDEMFSNESRNTRTNIVFRDFAFDANRTNQDGTQNGTRGIAIKPAVRCRFEHLYCFDGQNEAIDVARTGTEDVIIRGCRFENHNQGSGTSAHISIGTETLVTENVFIDCDDNAIFQVSGSSDMRITDNYFRDCASGAISPPVDVNGVVLSGNIFEGATTGIARFNDTGGTYQDYTITDNIVRNVTGTQTFAIDGQNDASGTMVNFTITDNTIECGGNTSGIRVRDGERVTICENQIETPRSTGILVDNVTDFTVSDNIIKDANDANGNNKAGVTVFGGTNAGEASTDGTVSGNVIRDTRSTPQQTNAIRAASSSVIEDLLIENNVCEGASGSLRNVDTGIAFLRFNNLGYNAGDPSSTGQWNGNGIEGLKVRDTTNSNTYVYNNGAWSQIAST